MTKFFEYPSHYTLCKKNTFLGRMCNNPEEFYSELCETIIDVTEREGKRSIRDYHGAAPGSVPIKGNEHIASYNLCCAEAVWHQCGCPYYKVDSAAIELFRKISMEVPFKYVVPPFESIVIRFEEDNPLIIEGDRRVKALIVSKAIDQAGRACMDVWGDCSEYVNVTGADLQTPAMSYLHLLAPDEETVGTQLKRALGNKNDSELCKAGLEEAVVRIAIAVCFLATSTDKMIRPDVLSKDLAAWAEAERKKDTSRMSVIAERAKRKGKLGYIVDGAREFLHTREEEHGHSSGDGSRHLKYRHMRSAHFRLFPSGKVRLIRMHPVRPDLPVRDT